MINERLSGAEALSDTTIGLACMFSVQESVRGDLENYNVHLRGLYQMIELRGGIHVFEDNLEVLQKIYRTDVQYALHTNSWPRYPYIEIPKHVMEELAITQGLVPRTISDIFQGTSTAVCQLVSDVERSCFMFNEICEKRRPTLAAPDFQGTLVSLCHRLVRIRLAEITTFSTVQRACLSGLACYISSLMLQFGRQRHLRRDLLRHELRSVIQEPLGEVACSSRVRLWLLMLGSISVFELEDDSWLLPLLNLEIETMGLQDWMQIEVQMRKFPWIGSFHCHQGKAMWSKLQNISTTSSLED
ncbi:Citrate synthase [Colletotrichum asianum]